MTCQITTYICPTLVNGISIESLEDILAIEYQDTLLAELDLVPRAKILTKIWPAIETPGCTLSKGKITTKICNASDLDCPYCLETASLRWYRVVTTYLSPLEGMQTTPQPYIAVYWNDPDQCHWVKSEIWMTQVSGRPMGDQMWAYSHPLPYHGPIPTEIDGTDVNYPKSEVFNSGTHGLADISNFTVPGELLVLRWCFDNTISYLAVQMIGVYFNTPAVTGGEITEVIGDYGNPDLRYKVLVEGEEVENCLPSDFAEYEVGDWVYLLKTNAPEASTCERDLAYGQVSVTEDEDETISGDELLEQINEIRQENGLGSLTMNVQLCAAASRHANDMALNHFLSHTGSDGSGPFERIFDTGFLSDAVSFLTGENAAVGYTTVDAVVEGWMNSPPHAYNILTSEFKEMGIAWKQGTPEWHDDVLGARTYWCQTFGYNNAHDPSAAPAVGMYRIVPFKINDIGPG